MKGGAGGGPISPEELCCEVFKVVFSELELGFDLLQLRSHILHRWGQMVKTTALSFLPVAVPPPSACNPPYPFLSPLPPLPSST